MNLSEQLAKSIEINKCFICNKKYIKLNKTDKKSCNNSNCNLVWFNGYILWLRYGEFDFILQLNDFTNLNINYINRTVLTNSQKFAFNYYNVSIDNYLKEQTLDNLFQIAHNISKILVFK